jgi:hypothetical protein
MPSVSLENLKGATGNKIMEIGYIFNELREFVFFEDYFRFG